MPTRRLPTSNINTLTFQDLLFEIGTEELPAAYVPLLIDQLAHAVPSLFHAHHLVCDRVQTWGTPRRLIVMVKGLDTFQRLPAEEIRGPSKQAAFDPKGNPTQALLGFLRSKRGTVERTRLVSSDRGEYVYLDQPASTVSTRTVLPAVLLQLLTALRPPKTMRWDASGVRFARPIRWLLVLYGRQPIRMTYGRVHSASFTYVGGPLRPRRLKVSSTIHYLTLLRRAGIEADPSRRTALIRSLVTKAAQRLHGAPAPEMLGERLGHESLLDEVTYLAEHPTVLVGSWAAPYLKLPREVLLASMAKHQRVFAVQSSNGKLLPHCIAILEGRPRKPAAVRSVIERILNARLADSLFFWNADHQRLPLATFGDLKGITFHEKLGTMEEKTQRLSTLSKRLAQSWGFSDEARRHLQRACLLAKFDLLSHMVKEFPTLQGVVGKYYALDSQEPREVAQAIEEQYLPVGDRSPTTLIGSALALLDKLDTLVSYFTIGIEPTGDQDPFGLRRAAQGIMEIAWLVHRPLLVPQLLHHYDANIVKRVQRYLLERLLTFRWSTSPHFKGPSGSVAVPPKDCLNAVFGSTCDDVVDAMDRIQVLRQLADQPGLLKAAKVIERTRNILKGATLHQAAVDAGRLQEPAERHLWMTYTTHHPRVAELIQHRKYAEATRLFGELFFEPLHTFFDQVLVNVPDAALQQNRLALLRAIHTLYTERVADLSQLTILQRPSSEPIPSGVPSGRRNG